MKRTTALAMVLSTMLIAACGSDDDNGSNADTVTTTESGSAPAGTAPPIGDDFEAQLAALYEGTYTEPNATPVDVEPGKNLWFVSIGQGIEPTVVAADALEEITADLGWDLTVFDSKFDPSVALTGIEQAIAAKADGIILWTLDCAAISNGLTAAAEAGIPTIAVESEDCDPGEFSHVVRYGEDNADFLEWFEGWGRTQAEWVIAKTEGEAAVILVDQTDLAVTQAVSRGWTSAFEDCAGCEIVDVVEFVGADFGPALQTKIEQSLIENPQANALIPAYDAVMTSGGAAAVATSGRAGDLIIAGGEGSTEGIEQIHASKGGDGSTMQMCVGLNSGSEIYAAVDALVRVFAGDDPLAATTGIGYQVCDENANLPAEGGIYQPPVDYTAIYRAAWGAD